MQPNNTPINGAPAAQTSKLNAQCSNLNAPTSMLNAQTSMLNAPTSMLKAPSLGRTELAQQYFPYILPKSAWEKLRSLLEADPDLAPLAHLKRRTFLPSEVNKIYQRLGQP